MRKNASEQCETSGTSGNAGARRTRRGDSTGLARLCGWTRPRINFYSFRCGAPCFSSGASWRMCFMLWTKPNARSIWSPSLSRRFPSLDLIVSAVFCCFLLVFCCFYWFLWVFIGFYGFFSGKTLIFRSSFGYSLLFPWQSLGWGVVPLHVLLLFADLYEPDLRFLRIFRGIPNKTIAFSP